MQRESKQILIIGTALIAILLCTITVLAANEDPPPWTKRDYAAPAEEVFNAARRSILAQHHELKNIDGKQREITFHVGMTAWSWGYNMVLTVTPLTETSSAVAIDVDRSGGKAFSWGRGKKEVEKILDGIENYLNKPATKSS